MSHTVEERLRRQSHQQRAYDIQFRGGVQGAIKWTIGGAIACALAHFTWPVFQRQTLALKGFLTSSAGVAGLVIGADDYLLRYEADMRRAENDLRRMARNDLARQGKIASEGEIRKWRQEYERKSALLVEAQAAAAEEAEKVKSGGSTEVR